MRQATDKMRALSFASGKGDFRREPCLSGKSIQIAAKKKENPRPAKPRDGWHF
jgi:hypothetical protein